MLELMKQQQQAMQARMESSDRRMETLLTQMASMNVRTGVTSGGSRDDRDDYDAGGHRGHPRLQLPKMQSGDDVGKFIKRLELGLTRN